MDPITQGAFGALWAGVAMAVRKEKRRPAKNNFKLALGVGALAGMAADLDVLIRSKTDPLLALQFHRQFTHSLIFIPVGALICALVFWLIFRKRFESFSQIYMVCFAGYASHGILDAFTSYGTQLYWPFSNYRVAWDSMSIVDPLFTVPLIALLIWRHRLSIYVALTFTIFYLGLGFVQRDRALAAVESLAQSRGHTDAARVQAKPSLGNLAVFRGIYEHQGRYYADAIRVPWWGGANKIYEGDSLPKVDPKAYQEIYGTVLYEDIQRFAWFSGDFLTADPRDPMMIADFRYSMLPNTVDPLWGIKVDLSRPDEHAPFFTLRDRPDRAFAPLWSMIRGQ